MPRKRNLNCVRAYHLDLKKRVVYQVYTLGMSTTEVSISLNMPLRVVQRVLKTWREIGEVCRDRSGLGRAPLMKGDSIKVFFLLPVFVSRTHVPKLMLALIEQTPDIYLDEIQEQLDEQHGLHVSLATIWRTLKRLGVTSKKACQTFYDTSCF